MGQSKPNFAVFLFFGKIKNGNKIWVWSARNVTGKGEYSNLESSIRKWKPIKTLHVSILPWSSPHLIISFSSIKYTFRRSGAFWSQSIVKFSPENSSRSNLQHLKFKMPRGSSGGEFSHFLISDLFLHIWVFKDLTHAYASNLGFAV